jgi:hypothetical protein
MLVWLAEHLVKYYSGFAEVGLRAVVTNDLTKGQFLQTGDHARAHPQRDPTRTSGAC